MISKLLRPARSSTTVLSRAFIRSIAQRFGYTAFRHTRRTFSSESAETTDASAAGSVESYVADETPIDSFTPEEVVSELDKFIIGQQEAKRAVALALRSRFRRAKLSTKMQAEVYPMNMLMSGPTGSGKTEIARRLAKLAQAPFVSVQATKYTETGVVGQDTDSMIEDLVRNAVKLETEMKRKEVASWANGEVEDILVNIIAGSGASKDAKDKIRADLRAGKLENKEVEIDLRALERERKSTVTVKKPSGLGGGFGGPFPSGMGGQFGRHGGNQAFVVGMPQSIANLGEAIEGLLGSVQDKGGKDKVERKSKYILHELRPLLQSMEENRKIDFEQVQQSAIQRAEQSGIVFLDEIDKLANSTEYQSQRGGRSFKGEGVQKELLALIEGTTVNTSFGSVNTHHILFVCAGAFSLSKPSDLLPELQGRLPIRVELKSLSVSDFRSILTQTNFNLLQQQIALFATEGVKLSFTDDAVEQLALTAAELNSTLQDIGARRLRTVVAKVLEDLSFNAPSKRGSTVQIDGALVRSRLTPLMKQKDLSKYIL